MRLSRQLTNYILTIQIQRHTQPIPTLELERKIGKML